MSEVRYSTGILRRGLRDGPHDDQVGRGYAVESWGFEYRDGLAMAAFGRQQLTASAIVASSYVSDVLRWVRAAGTERFYAMCAGVLWEASTNAFDSNTVRCFIDCSDSTRRQAGTLGTLSATGTALTGTNTRFLRTIDTSRDYFYYSGDGRSAAKLISSITNDTSATLASSYSGAKAGTAVIERRFSLTDAVMIVAGDRLFVFDGSARPHWYGDRGDGTWEFRRAGLPVPGTAPTVTLAGAAGGQPLSAGTYQYALCYEDAWGRLGNPVYTHEVTAVATDKATLGALVSGPAWAVYARIFRTKASQAQFFSVQTDFTTANPLDYKTLSWGTPSTTVTIADGSTNLVADMHIGRWLHFVTSGNDYLITDNTTTTIVVTGNASAETGVMTIEHGVDLDTMVASGWVDPVTDAQLDTDFQAPDENDEPPAKLCRPCLISGGGRLMAYEDDSQTRLWFTGRNLTANMATGESTGGLGEWDLWHNSLMAGNQDGDEVVQTLHLGSRDFALKQRSVWQIESEADDVADWFAHPAALASSVGCVAPNSVAQKEGVAYWFGYDGDQLDVIRFDGNVAFGLGRQRDQGDGLPMLRYVLSVTSSTCDLTKACGGIFQGRYYLSYAYDSTVNNRTLRYDIKTGTWDYQYHLALGRMLSYWNSSNARIMLACDASNNGLVYSVMATARDLGVGFARRITTQRFQHQDIAGKVRWTFVYVTTANYGSRSDTGNIIVYFSYDSYNFDDTGKTWTQLTVVDTWPTALGEHIVRFRIPAGQVSRDAQVRIDSTDDESWAIKEIAVDGIEEGPQKRPTASV